MRKPALSLIVSRPPRRPFKSSGVFLYLDNLGGWAMSLFMTCQRHHLFRGR